MHRSFGKANQANFKALGPVSEKIWFDFQRDTGFSADNINQLESNGTIE
jgi:hypothetical protein